MHICAEIQYENTEGSVHSDICLVSGLTYTNDDWTPESFTEALSDKYRAFLHANLDEWLDKGFGTGIFYIGDPTLLAEE